MRATHPGYVLDASVVAKWFTRHREDDRERAVGLRDLHRAGRCRLIVPELAVLEVLNAIRFSARAEEADLASALAVLRDLGLQREPLDWSLLQYACAVAWAYRVALYDAVYVALAERLGLPLVTADDKLVRALRGHRSVVRLREIEPGS